MHHLAFVIEAIFKNNETVSAKRGQFHAYSNIGCHGAFPCQNTILKMVNNFCNTASALKIKPNQRPCAVQMSVNIETVCASVLQHP